MTNKAAFLGVPIALGCLEFSKKKAGLRYENAHPSARQRSARLSSFACQKLIGAVVGRAKKLGVEVRFVDPSWTSVVGWAKYGSRLGMNPDQAAAFAIARRGVLSKGKNIKRTKRGPEWIDLCSKPEKISGLAPAALKENNKSKKASSKTKLPSRPQRSMGAALGAPERMLSLALGSDRVNWAAKLKALRLRKASVGPQSREAGTRPAALLAWMLGKRPDAWGDQASPRDGKVF